MPLHRVPAVAAALVALTLTTLGLPGATAQEATPVAEATPQAAAIVLRPIHIQSGDCTTLGEVVQPLTDLTAPAGELVGQGDAATVAESSFTTVPVTLDVLLATPHAINAHLSPEAIDTYIACGEIGGIFDINGQLIIGLRESSGSGYTGIAFLIPGDDGASTNVSVFLAPVLGAAG